MVQRREGRKIGRRYPSPSDSTVWKRVVNSTSGVRDRAPVENGFVVIYSKLISSDARRWMAAMLNLVLQRDFFRQIFNKKQ